MFPLMLLAEPINVTIKYDFSIWDIFLKTIIMSIRVISNNGLWILAFISVCVVVSKLFKSFSSGDFLQKGLDRRSMSRQIFSADMDRNFDDMVTDGVKHKFLSSVVNRKFSKLYKKDILADGVEHKILSSAINRKYAKSHIADMIDDGVQHKVISSLVNNRFGQKHMQLEINQKVHNMEVSHKAALAFDEQHPEAYGEMSDLRKAQAKRYYESRKSKGQIK